MKLTDETYLVVTKEKGCLFELMFMLVWILTTVCFLSSEEECPCLKLETGGPQHLEKRKNLIKAVCVLLMLITVAKVKSELVG